MEKEFFSRSIFILAFPSNSRFRYSVCMLARMTRYARAMSVEKEISIETGEKYPDKKVVQARLSGNTDSFGEAVEELAKAQREIKGILGSVRACVTSLLTRYVKDFKIKPNDACMLGVGFEPTSNGDFTRSPYY